MSFLYSVSNDSLALVGVKPPAANSDNLNCAKLLNK